MKSYTPEQKEAITDVLNLLLKYEGGRAQTIPQTAWRKLFNVELRHMAASHQLTLDPAILKYCGISH